MACWTIEVGLPRILLVFDGEPPRELASLTVSISASRRQDASLLVMVM